ncbi:MAG: Na+/H+ antiporter NhaA, partial [Planctomycetaceae bacterium]|nr:Na+/H+ antiporter NhaA [Planctomycetaceae bacterium]
MRRLVEQLQEFSIPLIAGVVAAIAFANFDPEGYHYLVHTPLTEMLSSAEHAEVAAVEADHEEALEGSHASTTGAHEANGFSHYLTLHFLANDLLMVLFFGIAAKEITEACLPGGKLTPLSKAVNPLFATAGGVLGPIAVYLTLNTFTGSAEWSRGWGIPTATDIALAWLVARMLFGKTHPAVSFLLLLAVADDAIGLGIIAIGYPDPNHPTEWAQVLWLVPGMLAAYGFRIWGVRSWIPYIVVGGAFCWWGLFCAGLHPALAFVFVVPFLPGPKHDAGLFVEVVDEDESGDVHYVGHTPLESFEHSVKGVVDWGLFLFAFANA